MKDFDLTFTHYNRGDIITGTIVMIGSKEVTVAIGGLREGVFPREELEQTFTYVTPDKEKVAELRVK